MKERYFSMINVITPVLRLKNLELNRRFSWWDILRPLSEIWDIYRINRHQLLFWHFKEGHITARVFFFVFVFFVISNVRFELPKLEMICRVKLGIIMPSLVTVQNAALGRFSTDRQYLVLLYIPCKFWL